MKEKINALGQDRRDGNKQVGKQLNQNEKVKINNK